MKKLYQLLLIVVCMSGGYLHAQNVMTPSDPDSVFTSTNRPPLPAWGPIVKWGHTKSLNWGGTGTTTFKSYWYKGMQFRVKFPKSYQQGVNDGMKYPVYVFFHGAGEGGNAYDNESQLIHGGQVFRDAVDNGKFDGFLFYYQSSDGYAQPFFGDIDNILDTLVKYNKADPDRIVIDGLSSGGQSCWDFLGNSPKYIAAAPIISAARNEYVPVMPTYIQIPIWLFNGGQDTNPGPATAQYLVDTFTNLGGNIKHNFYPNNGHNCWDAAWADTGFIPYMLAAHKTNPLLYFGKSNFCPGDVVSAKMGVTPGFYAYQWMKDGTVISGATSNTYTATALGTYSVRFQRTSTSGWSDWSHKPITLTGGAVSATPNIQLNGIASNVLPAPDGSTTAPLMEPAGYLSYKWTRVSDNAVVGTSNIYNAAPGTYIAQVTAKNACSSTASAPFTVVNAAAAGGPDPASNLTAGAVSQIAVQLNWSKNPHPNVNETGFEVYRGLKSGGPYTLVAVTPKDTVNYLDQGLAASTSYYYIVRAVNASAGSKVTNEALATTQKDTIPPTAPSGLAVTATTSNSVGLSWNPSTDFVGVVNYDIYVNGVKTYTIPGVQNSFTVYNLTDKQAYAFSVKARDAAGNNSAFSNQVTANAVMNGLTYKYYTGTWSTLPNFNSLTPVSTGTTTNLSLAPATVANNYGFLWTGYITITKAGTYTLETSSDDGSALWLGSLGGTTAYNPGGTPLVNNDGAHAQQSKTASKTLQKGTYPIAFTYFQATGGAAMQAYWTCTLCGISRSQIPDSAFAESGAVTGAIPAAPSNLSANALAYNAIKLTWTDNSTNETGFELYRSTSPSGPFNIVTTTGAAATSFTDSTVAASTQYFYRIRAVGLFGASAYDAIGAGAAYNYYNNVSLSALPNFATMTPTFTGVMPNFSLGMETQSTNFAVQYNTTIKITTGGTYTFSTTSDDGSALWVNGVKVVNNDGSHGSTTVSGSISLAAGTYPITAGYFQGGGGYNFSVNYKGPGISNQVIPAAVLGKAYATATTPAGPAAPKAPSSLNATVLNSSSISLTWSDAFNDATSFQIQRSTGNTNGYRTIATVPGGAGPSFSYVDAGLFDNVTYYYMVNGVNVGGTGAVSNTASATTPLNNPQFASPIRDFTMKYGTTNTVQVSATSPDNVPLTITALNLPSFAALTDNGNGTASILFSPASSDQATYNNIVIVATASNGGIAKDTFNLVVNSNNPPVVANIANATYDAGTTDTIAVSATDLDGLTGLVWSANNLPSWGTLVDNGNGSASVVLKPTYISQGTYSITIVATDAQGGNSAKTFTVTINPKNPNQRFLVNMVYSNFGPTPWNNMTGPKLTNLKSTDGQTTNVSVSLSQPSWWQPWYLGAQTGNNSGVYPDAVLADYYYFGIFGGPDVVYDTVSGLKPNAKYNFKFLASSTWTGVPDNGTTVYTIGSQSASCYAQNNTANTANIDGAVSDANGRIVIAMSKAAGTQIGYLNAWEFSYNFDDSTAPALPTGLAATIVPGIGVQLNWNAIAYNAQAYNVYRATDTTQPFTLLNPAGNNGQASSYLDSTVSGHTTYYYKLKAVNQYGDLGYTNVVSATTAARNPTISAIANTSVNAGATANISFTATDDPGDAVTVTANLPTYATLQNNGNGNYNIALAPTTGNIGSFAAMVIATDSYGASDTATFTLSVVETNVKSLFMHFGNDTAVAPKPWNNLLGYPFGNTAFANLQWADGTASGITLTLVDQWNNAAQPLGMKTGNNSGIYPDKVMANALFENTTNARRVKLTGLDASKTYNLAVLSSVNGGFPSSATFTVGTTNLDINPAYNSNTVGQFNGLKPDATGAITLTMTKDAASTYGFLNALVLQMYDPAVVPVVSPNNLYVEASPTNKTTLKLVWSDRASNETGFQIWRSTSPTSGFTQIATVGAGVTTYTNTGLTPDTRYFYEVRATASGGLLSDYSNIATAVTPAYIVLENLTWKYPTTRSPWNNTGVNPEQGDVFGNLINDQGLNTGLAYTVINDFNGEYAAGMNSGNNSYIFPDSVMMSNYWCDHGQIATLQLSGLDVSKKYRIGMEGSSTWNGDMTATMNINTRTVYLNTYMNTSKVVYIDSVTPNSNGIVNLNFSATGTYGFIGSIVVMAYTDNGYQAGTGGVTSTAIGNTAVNGVTANALRLGTDSTNAANLQLQSFVAYPNPFRDGFTIGFNATDGNQEVDIQVFNAAGMVLYHQSGIYTHPGTNLVNVNLSSSLPTGWYFATVRIAGKVEKVFKLVKNK